MRGYARLSRDAHGWVDPIKRGWPGPMDTWTEDMWAVFEEHACLASGRNHEARAWAEGYRAVVLMPEGRA